MREPQLGQSNGIRAKLARPSKLGAQQEIILEPRENLHLRTDNYEIADSGRWTIKKGPGWVQLTQEVNDHASGYGYF